MVARNSAGTKRRLKKSHDTRFPWERRYSFGRARARGARSREAMAGRKRCSHGKLKYKCSACKSARAERPIAPEVKLEPGVKQEPFTIRDTFGIGE